MSNRCTCGSAIPQPHGDLGCIQCGRQCCSACGSTLESVTYCDRCAGAILGVEVLAHIGVSG